MSEAAKENTRGMRMAASTGTRINNSNTSNITFGNIGSNNSTTASSSSGGASAMASKISMAKAKADKKQDKKTPPKKNQPKKPGKTTPIEGKNDAGNGKPPAKMMGLAARKMNLKRRIMMINKRVKAATLKRMMRRMNPDANPKNTMRISKAISENKRSRMRLKRRLRMLQMKTRLQKGRTMMGRRMMGRRMMNKRRMMQGKR